MKYGKKDVYQLKEDDLRHILESIIDDCVQYAGDSYFDFSRSVIKFLVKNKLVDYEKQNR